jgi:hypothetical protein
VITDDELAAIAAALMTVEVTLRCERESASLEGPSRWKYAARNPDLDIEDYRSV